MSDAQRKQRPGSQWNRDRVTRVVRRALESELGDAWELTVAVALFEVGERMVPEGGKPLWDFVEAAASAVEKQKTRRAAEAIRQRLARELRPALSRNDVTPSPSRPPDRYLPAVQSGYRNKVRSDGDDGDGSPGTA